VNLEEVAQAVRDGAEVQVVDAATGEDITRLILTQIIVESAKSPESSFPLDVLRQMVVASGRASQESALKYMQAMFDMYQNAYRAIPQPLSPLDFMQTMMGTAVRGRAAGTPPEDPQSPAQAGATAARAGGEEQSEVSELKRRIEQLESLVRNRGGRRRSQKAKKPKPRA
jgi:polyhydroxyalkanoate synthesis repressor PhaR